RYGLDLGLRLCGRHRRIARARSGDAGKWPAAARMRAPGRALSGSLRLQWVSTRAYVRRQGARAGHSDPGRARPDDAREGRTRARRRSAQRSCRDSRGRRPHADERAAGRGAGGAAGDRERLRRGAAPSCPLSQGVRRYEPRRFLVRAAFLAARERAVRDGRPTALDGTRLPERRASERPIAIACLRLFTLPPLPLLSVPRLYLRISRSTSFEALRAYLLAMSLPPFGRQHWWVDL